MRVNHALGLKTNERVGDKQINRVKHALGSKTDERVKDKQINPVNEGIPCPKLKGKRKGR